MTKKYLPQIEGLDRIDEEDLTNYFYTTTATYDNAVEVVDGTSSKKLKYSGVRIFDGRSYMGTISPLSPSTLDSHFNLLNPFYDFVKIISSLGTLFSISKTGYIYTADDIETETKLKSNGSCEIKEFLVVGDETYTDKYFYSEGDYNELWSFDSNIIWDFYNPTGDFALGLRFSDNIFLVGTDYMLNSNNFLNINTSAEFGLGVLPVTGYKLTINGKIANPSSNDDDLIFSNLKTDGRKGFKFESYDGLGISQIFHLSKNYGAQFGQSKISGKEINVDDGVFDGLITNKDIVLEHTQYWFTDFCSAYAYNQSIWYVAGLNGGASSVWSSYVDNNHIGVNYIRCDGVTANSGAWILTSIANFIIGGNEKQHFIIKPLLYGTNIYAQLGFWDNQLTPTDAVMFKLLNGAFYGSCSSAGTSTNSTSPYTLTSTNWLNLYITINADASSVLFEIYDSPKTTLLWSDTITTNIPTGSGRNVGNGITFAETSGTLGSVAYMVALDFMDLKFDRVLSR